LLIGCKYSDYRPLQENRYKIFDYVMDLLEEILQTYEEAGEKATIAELIKEVITELDREVVMKQELN
jgi:regulator of replication initiation timing